MSKNSITFLFILISHLFPLYGLLFLGWSPYQTVIVFNIETLIIIFFFLLEMLVRLIANRELVAIVAMFLVFPLIGFNVIHLALATLMFGTSGYSLTWEQMSLLFYIGFFAIIPGILLMLGRHLYAFIGYITNKSYTKRIPKHGPPNLLAIFIRIFFMQFTIIFGGVFAKVSGHISWGVSILILLQLLYSLIQFKNYVKRINS